MISVCIYTGAYRTLVNVIPIIPLRRTKRLKERENDKKELSKNDCALALGREMCYMQSVLNISMNKNKIIILGSSLGVEEREHTHYPVFLNRLRHQTQGRVETPNLMNTDWSQSAYKNGASIQNASQVIRKKFKLYILFSVGEGAG